VPPACGIGRIGVAHISTMKTVNPPRMQSLQTGTIIVSESDMFRRLTRPAVPIGCGLVLIFAAASVTLPAAGQGAALPTGRQIVDRHVAAIGGAAAYKGLQSMHAVGSLSMPAQQITGQLEIFAARPNRQLLRMDIAGVGKAETGYDGKYGWSIDPVSGATLMTGRQLAELVDSADFDSTLYLPSDIKELTTVGRETFDKRAAYRVKIVTVNDIERVEFFDVESGLQLGTEARRQTPLGVAPVTTFVRDYKTFGGLQLPTTLVQTLLGIEQVMTITSYEFNTVQDAMFALPPQIKALIKPPTP
jgi:hypothetical protein